MTSDVHQLRARLADARLYLCTDARRRQGDLAWFLDAVLSAGVDIVQLREKGLEAAEELALLEVFAAACRRHGRLLAVNDRADVALAAGADVLHLGQDDLPVSVARHILGPGPIIGLSSHSPVQADAAAAEPGVDYFCAGPLWVTPTKPGRPATGLGLLAHVTQAGPARPWFAIGGISLDRLDDVLAAGATRVVVVRAITEADDPAAATRAFAKRLRQLAREANTCNDEIYADHRGGVDRPVRRDRAAPAAGRQDHAGVGRGRGRPGNAGHPARGGARGEEPRPVRNKRNLEPR